jgi:hypothetical protein
VAQREIPFLDSIRNIAEIFDQEPTVSRLTCCETMIADEDSLTSCTC